MNAGNNRVPKLRFPEFTKNWKQCKLREIADKVTDKNKDMVVKEVFTNSAEQGIISQKDYFDRDIANRENISGYYIVKPNDFVYNPRVSTTAPFGPIKRNHLGRSGAMSPLYYVFRSHHINQTYLEWYFQTNCWHSFMRFNGNSGARSDRFTIGDKLFNEMPISIPQDIDEQNKIGDFFDTLNSIITIQQRTLDTLHLYRKSLLQKMFPKEGEKIPEIRFPEFEGEWEVKELSELLTQRIEKRKISEKEPLLAFSYAEGVIDPEDKKSNKRDFLMTDKDNKVFLRTEYDDIIYNPANVIHGAVHRNSLKAGVVSPIYKIFKCNEGVSPKYMGERLHTDSFINEASKYIEGTVIKLRTLSPESFLKMKIEIPKSLKEQEKIGDFFLSIDNRIKLQEKQLSDLQQYKKSLLQKMFC